MGTSHSKASPTFTSSHPAHVVSEGVRGEQARPCENICGIFDLEKPIYAEAIIFFTRSKFSRKLVFVIQLDSKHQNLFELFRFFAKIKLKIFPNKCLYRDIQHYLSGGCQIHPQSETTLYYHGHRNWIKRRLYQHQ